MVFYCKINIKARTKQASTYFLCFEILKMLYHTSSRLFTTRNEDLKRICILFKDFLLLILAVSSFLLSSTFILKRTDQNCTNKKKQICLTDNLTYLFSSRTLYYIALVTLYNLLHYTNTNMTTRPT